MAKRKHKPVNVETALRIFRNLHEATQRAGIVDKAVAKKIRDNVRLLARRPKRGERGNSRNRKAFVHDFLIATQRTTMPEEALLLFYGAFGSDDLVSMGALRREPVFRRIKNLVATTGFRCSVMAQWAQDNPVR
jgi:hypothetical protein